MCWKLFSPNKTIIAKELSRREWNTRIQILCSDNFFLRSFYQLENEFFVIYSFLGKWNRWWNSPAPKKKPIFLNSATPAYSKSSKIHLLTSLHTWHGLVNLTVPGLFVVSDRFPDICWEPVVSDWNCQCNGTPCFREVLRRSENA